MLLEYRLESVLGVGGFGMTYLGWDTNLEKHVAIKEYLPSDLAVRALDGSIVPVSTKATSTTSGASTGSSRRPARSPASGIRTLCGSIDFSRPTARATWLWAMRPA